MADETKGLIMAQTLLRDCLGPHDPGAFSRDASLERLGVDSLDTLEMIMAAEDALGVEIDDDAFDAFTTVGEIADFLEGLING